MSTIKLYMDGGLLRCGHDDWSPYMDLPMNAPRRAWLEESVDEQDQR